MHYTDQLLNNDPNGLGWIAVGLDAHGIQWDFYRGQDRDAIIVEGDGRSAFMSRSTEDEGYLVVTIYPCGLDDLRDFGCDSEIFDMLYRLPDGTDFDSSTLLLIPMVMAGLNY